MQHTTRLYPPRASSAPPRRPPPARARPRSPPPRARAAALAFITHIDAIQYTTHNSSKFGAGAQTAAPGPRSSLYTSH